MDSTYAKQVGHDYWTVRFDRGLYGEYLTFCELSHYEDDGAKFLFNLYLPTNNGHTTEIDMLMICRKGVFVIESKKLSGWIGGSENQAYWYQTLPARYGCEKHRFFNPIKQNHAHIKALQSRFHQHLPTHSIIAFSDRCEFKQLQITNSNVSVIHRCQIAGKIAQYYLSESEDKISTLGITNIYNRLYAFSQVDERIKQLHIAHIKQKG